MREGERGREREILGGGWGNEGGREREYSQSQSSDECEGSHAWTQETHCVLRNKETIRDFEERRPKIKENIFINPNFTGTPTEKETKKKSEG